MTVPPLFLNKLIEKKGREESAFSSGPFKAMGWCVQSDAQSTGWGWRTGRWEKLHPLVRPWVGTVALAMGGALLVYTTLGKICSIWARLKLPTLPLAERHSCTTGFWSVSVFCTLSLVPHKAMVIGLGGGGQNKVGTLVEIGLQSLEHLNPQSWPLNWPFGEMWTKYVVMGRL